MILVLQDRYESPLSIDPKNVPVALHLTAQWNFYWRQSHELWFYGFWMKIGKILLKSVHKWLIPIKKQHSRTLQNRQYLSSVNWLISKLVCINSVSANDSTEIKGRHFSKFPVKAHYLKFGRSKLKAVPAQCPTSSLFSSICEQNDWEMPIQKIIYLSYLSPWSGQKFYVVN